MSNEENVDTAYMNTHAHLTTRIPAISQDMFGKGGVSLRVCACVCIRASLVMSPDWNMTCRIIIS